MTTNASAKVTQTLKEYERDDGLTKLEYFTGQVAAGLAARTNFNTEDIPSESKRIAWGILHNLNADE